MKEHLISKTKEAEGKYLPAVQNKARSNSIKSIEDECHIIIKPRSRIIVDEIWKIGTKRRTSSSEVFYV